MSLAKELVDFLVPSFGCSGDYFHPIDSVGEPDWNSSTEVVNNCGGMGSGIEFCFDDLELEFPHILWEIVVIANSGIGEPSGSLSSRVCALEGGLKIFDKVWEGSEGGGVQGHLSMNGSPALGCSFSHEGEGVSDLFIVGGINIFVYEEICSDRVQPVFRCGGSSVVCFGHVQTEFSGFG